MNNKMTNNNFNLWGSNYVFVAYIVIASFFIGILQLLFEFSILPSNDMFFHFLKVFPGEIIEALFNLSLLFTTYFIFINFFRKISFWKRIVLFLFLSILSISLETLFDFLFPILNLDFQPIDFEHSNFFIFSVTKDIFFYFILILFFGYIDYLHCKRTLLYNQFLEEKNRATQEEANRMQVELHALQSQINPHFLFNTLNSLSTLILTSPKQAENLLANMAVLYRKVLGASSKSLWPLIEEIALINTYLNIELIRFGEERLSYELFLPDNLKNIFIPPLLIHTLVENSVKHGVLPYINGGKITVKVEQEKELIITVNDIRREKEQSISNYEGLNSGLNNLKKRLYLIYGENAIFNFVYNSNGSTSVIKIQNL